MCCLKTAILDAELVNVPIVNENGTTDVGSNKFSIGIRIKLAPPPAIALSQKATIVTRKRMLIFIIIFSKTYRKALRLHPWL